MPEIIQYLKVAFRDNFGAMMLLVIAGTIALAFIGYLLIDYIRTVLGILRMKRRQRREHRHS